jgi:putative membrane protein
MKKLIMPLLAAGLILSCTDSSNKNDTTKATTVTDSIKPNPDTNRGNVQDTANRGTTGQPADAASVDFVNNAASANMLEIQLANLAQQKAKSQRVKNFANMMITDHTQAGNDLKGITTPKSIPVPSALKTDDQSHLDQMNKKPAGAEFEKEYMNMMVNGHTKVLNDFKKASNELKDAELRMFAIKTIPVIEKHLDSAKAILGKK